MADNCAAATRAEIAEGARLHYKDVSTQSCCWMNTIEKAIDSWEREPELLAQLDALTAERDALAGRLEKINEIAKDSENYESWSFWVTLGASLGSTMAKAFSLM